jgi:formate dehydrogenase subunit delta
MNSVERLVYMANQIAANLAMEDDPVAATANHIMLFWHPRMKKMILENDGSKLSQTAAAAIRKLAQTHDTK